MGVHSLPVVAGDVKRGGRPTRPPPEARESISGVVVEAGGPLLPVERVVKRMQVNLARAECSCDIG